MEPRVAAEGMTFALGRLPASGPVMTAGPAMLGKDEH
jgi:hypothetical protein